MGLYTGSLNEFIDWISNRDIITNRKTIVDTISGGSIRELLQSHLRKPFYVHEDIDNNRKLLFSSEESKIRYFKAVEEAGGNENAIAQKYKDLVLLEFDIPAPHKIICVGENDEVLKTMNILSGSARQMIKFKVYIDDKTSGLNSSYEVKFKLVGPNNQVTYEDVRTYDSTSTTDVQLFDCFDYLQTGSNTLTLSIRLTGDISAEKINPQIPINIISYNISAEYATSNWFDPISIGSNLPINMIVNRSISTPVSQTISYYIDDYSNPKGTITKNIEGLRVATSLTIPNDIIRECVWPQSGTEESMHPKHYLLIKGNMSTTDNSINFDSNSLLYEFITQSDEQEELNNHFIIIKLSIPAGSLQTSNGMEGIYLTGIQYEEFILDWAYFTNGGTDASISVEWELCQYDTETGEVIEDSRTYLATLSGIRNQVAEPLRFVPDQPYLESENWHLVGTVLSNIKDSESGEPRRYKAFDRQIIIERSSFEFEFNEWAGYVFKLNAYGRTNSESETSRTRWMPTGTILNTANIPQMNFSPSIPWDSANGWSNNSLTFNSETCFGTINFNAFPSGNQYLLSEYGRTIEIDFMSGSVNNDEDPLIIIGANGETSRTYEGSTRTNPAIYIYPTKAVMYSGATEVIKTNYKSNERIQLTFIFMPNTAIKDAKNVYIVNNGVLERGANLSDQTISNANGWIRIGGTNSQISLYNIRVWWRNMPVYDAFTNFLFDAPNKSSIIIRNSITKGSGSSEIDYDRCVSKIDTFLISGNINNILTPGVNKEDSETPVNILYTTPSDGQYLGFNATAVKMRKHGQSTLNYPIASFKFWLNKSKGENNPQVEFKDGVKNLRLVKNRYPINIGSIPSNKYVLQANYADSSGVHNGGLLRLINETWYNAPFKKSNGVIEYKLRTSPQLFTSNQTVIHNDTLLNEVGSSVWTDGYGNTDVEINGVSAKNHTWGDLRIAETGNAQLTAFPYKLRNAPDSRPAVVFYTDTSSAIPTKKFLGQFVLMDDKKSDHIFGERSIYLWGDGNDPFCMTTEGADTPVIINGKTKKGYDQDEFCVWDNKRVLRIECVLINTPLTSFMDFNVPNDIVIDKDGNTEDDQTFTNDHAASDIKYETDPSTGEFILDENGNKKPLNYYWEDYFEMIFPDEDDISEDDAAENLNKFSGVHKTPEQAADPNYKWPEGTSKFIKKAQPWIDFLRWICSIGQLNKDSQGNPIINGNVSTAALNKFKSEAHDHLDLYKLAAYYIFYIRFGLVDSVERNAQYKTYDGLHWFLEPWDMDIALGNKNTGGLAFDPPMDRTTMLDATSQTYAYSGRSKTTSNVLWDCLEKWDYWRDVIVPETAQALYEGGLTYDKITEMFDNNFANKWAELVYNESGMYKYVEKAQDATWLNWLQGSRTSHRHWWISTSMNYYDSKWTCGQFNSSRIYMAVDKPQGTEAIITVVPTSESYFKLTQMDTTLNRGLYRATKSSPARWDATNWSFSTKDPSHLFGALFMEKIDLDVFGQGLQVLSFQNAVDPVLGATIKELSIGSRLPEDLESPSRTQFTGWIHKVAPSITNSSSTTSEDDSEGAPDALENIITYNITGQLGLKDGDIIKSNRAKLKNIYAIGTGFTTLTSSALGNVYENVHLPGRTLENTGSTVKTTPGVISINVTNTSWKNITFWETSYNSSGTERVPYEINGEVQRDENGDIIYIENPTVATFKKMNRIPKEFKSLTFKGSTANNVCTLEFVLDWFNSIEYYVSQDNPELSGDALERKVLEYIGNNCTASLDNIRWNYNKSFNDPDYRPITYKDVVRLGYLNGMPDENGIGVNWGTNSSLKGYVKIEGENMKPAQLTELSNLFGENVFTLSNINSNLVIDQESNYAQISVSGNIHIETDTTTGESIIVANEGSLIKFKCTSFLLSSESVENYVWTINGAEGNTFENAPDGFTRNLILDQTTKPERYTITITATKIGDQSINSSVIVYIDPTITARDFKFEPVNGRDVRRFICDEVTARNMFGNNAMVNGQLRDIFIIPKGGMQQEFKLDTTTEFDATIHSVSFRIGAINNSLPIRETASTGWTGNELSVNDSTEYYVTTNEVADGELIKVLTTADSYINRTKKVVNGILTGVRNSIKFKTCDDITLFNTTCEDMKYFTLYGSVKYNSPSIGTHTYACNIILYDDSNFILSQSSKAFAPILRKLKEYNTEYYSPITSLYKSDLSVLNGTLDFKDDQGNTIDMANDAQSFIASGKNESIFNYMPNIQILDFTGLTYNFEDFATQGKQYFNMKKLRSLNKLILKDCPATSMDLLIENSSTIQELDLSGNCNAGLICKNNPALTTISLGKPSLINISDCASLTNNGVTITDNSLVNSIDLKSTSTDSLIMFKLLNKFLA